MNCPILMDGRMLIDARTGVATYARSLRAAINELSPAPGLLLDRPSGAGSPHRPSGKSGRIVRALWPGARRAVKDHDEEGEGRYRVPDAFRLAQVFFDIHGKTLPIRIPGRPGIAHWSYPLPLHAAGWINIYTIHDLIPIIHPGMSPIDPRRHRRLLTAVFASADGIVTVSEASRRELETEFQGGPLPIINCGQPVDLGSLPGALPAPLRERGYLLVLGSVETRKNIPAIIAGYHRSGVDLPLVIAGPDGWGASAIASTVNDPKVVRLPYLPSDTIRALLSHAKALIMASLAEGFGLPVAEAMALGTPVITSDQGALAETAGGAALLVSPTDETSIAAAIRMLVTNDGIWTDLRSAGLARAYAFTPHRFSARLGETYRQLRGDTLATSQG